MRVKIGDGTLRREIKRGDFVEVVQKQHQRSGELTEGHVDRILTSSAKHTRGIKVRLETGEVGRVQAIYEEE